MTDELADFYILTATVETLTGTDGYGRGQFASPIVLDPETGNGCWVENTRKLVRSATGDQVVSESTLYAYPANAELFTPGSRVTIRGAQSTVIRAALNESGPLDLPDHVAVTLT